MPERQKKLHVLQFRSFFLRNKHDSHEYGDLKNQQMITDTLMRIESLGYRESANEAPDCIIFLAPSPKVRQDIGP